MGDYSVFRHKTAESLLDKANELDLELPFQEDISPLLQPVEINGKQLPNRLAVHPMEGFDSEPDGSPGEFTFRRYSRYASGGSGLIWFEATSVMHEGRSNPHQLMLAKQTVDGFKRLVESTHKAAENEFGASHTPYLVLQLTHSGRYSKPDGKPLHKAMASNPHLNNGIEPELYMDAELEQIKEQYEKSIQLAAETGFDAVDIKVCHGYLLHEMLGAHTRKDSKYAGTFENRTRFLMDLLEYTVKEVPGILPAVRMNATDGVPYPYGFGMKSNGSMEIDLNEPERLIEMLNLNGCKLLNLTAGIPYHSPFMVRPFDRTAGNAPNPEEHPLRGVMRMVSITGEMQKKFPELPIVGTGYTWLRTFFPNVGAAVLERNMASLIGLGRSSFAYPDAPKDLMEQRKLSMRKACVSCSRCTELMKSGHKTGCVIRDRDIYRTEYNLISG